MYQLKLHGVLLMLTLGPLHLSVSAADEPFAVFRWADFLEYILGSGVLMALWVVFIARIARDIRAGRLPRAWLLASLWYVMMLFALYSASCDYLADLRSGCAQVPWGTDAACDDGR